MEENLQIGTSPFKWCNYRFKRWSATLTRRPYWFSQKRNELHGWYHNDSCSKFQNLFIVRSRYKTLSAKLPLYISQRIALVLVCPQQTTYVSKKTCACPKKRWLGHSPSEWCRDSDSHRRTLSRRPVYQTLNSRSNNSRLVELRAAARTIGFRRQID